MQAPEIADSLEVVADELVECRGDPVRFVETMFDWGSPELKGKAPEPWQREVLFGLRDDLPLNKAVRIRTGSPRHSTATTSRLSAISGACIGSPP